MRQGQQNRRGRGRNRKGQSPLTRSFESTGPDVKIRGTPAHIAEKYMSLARDASSSGDPVLAENYLQHAEHYNRIIMAFRDQHMGGPGAEGMNGGMGRNRPFMSPDGMEAGDEFSEEDGDEVDTQPQPMRQHEHQPQPRMDNQRFEGHRGGHDQHRYRDRSDRPDRQDRQGGGEQRSFQPPRPQPAEAGAQAGPEQQPSPDNQMRRRERFPQGGHEQPEFLRRPVRRPRREGNGGPGDANGSGGPEGGEHD
jgi:hypothetical protein